MRTLIVGSGITGIVSAIDIAESGGKVTIIEKNNYATGTLAKLERQFPNDACGMCQIYPFTGEDIPQYCLRRIFFHKNVEIMTNTEIVDVKGEGPFNVIMKKNPRGVIISRCISCKKCEDVCPVYVDDEFNPVFGKRKAIYTDYPIPFPLSYSIDFKSCTRCGKCVEVCPTNAIDLDMKEEIIEMNFDRIILTTGFEDVNPEYLKEYGYKRFKNVLTSIEFERGIAFTGPNLGEILRPSDRKRPENIAFIQCVGSRDKKNPFCSFVCCMFALKEINLVKRFFPEIKTSIFYMDMRTFGKGYYRYQLKTDTEFIKQRVASIQEVENNNLLIKYEDEEGKIKEKTFELVVLSIGQVPNLPNFVSKDEYGYPLVNFINSENKKGIFVAGSSSYPKDIMDAVIEGHSVALDILKINGTKKEKMEGRKVERKVGIILCDCFGLIDYPDIEFNYDTLRMKDFCQNIDSVREWIKEKGINTILLSACSKYFLTPILSGLDIDYEIADVREQVVFNNSDKNGIEYLIASRLKMIENRMEIQGQEEVEFLKDVAIIGGGIAGLTVAKELSDSGVNVHIIEKKDKLGGNGLKVKKHITGFDIYEHTLDLINFVKNNKNINILLNSNVEGIKGGLGDFRIKIDNGEEIKAGFIVLSTGASEYKPKEYNYGKNRNIMTQIEFEDLIEKEDFKNKNIIMIQCVGSRNNEAKYCSRVCCSKAIMNAIRIKEKYSDANIFVLYRDMMSYGTREVYYKKAREMGVIFLRFKEGREPDVISDNGLFVRVFDEVLNDSIEINADYVILSTGIRQENTDFYKKLGIEIDEDGFVKEANVKFKPLETPRPGIYVCGLAHSPRDTYETIRQARGVAAIILSLIKKGIYEKKRISFTKERFCSGCGFCVDVCPYNARYLDDERKVSIVYTHLCQGCGTCVGVCPSGAADMKEMGYNEIFSGIEILKK